MAKVACIDERESLLAVNSTAIPRLGSIDSVAEDLFTLKPGSEKKNLDSMAKSLLGLLPRTLFDHWSSLANKTGIAVTKQYFDDSMYGLLCFLTCSRLANTVALALPSKAVVLAWESWTTHDVKSWKEVCALHFPLMVGVDLKASSNVLDDKALAVCYFVNCILEDRDCTIGELPLLFTLDYKLKHPSGYRFAHIAKPEDGMYHCELDQTGNSANRRWFIHRMLSVGGLRGLGLLRVEGDALPEGKVFYEARSTARGSGIIYESAAVALCAVLGFEHKSLA